MEHGVQVAIEGAVLVALVVWAVGSVRRTWDKTERRLRWGDRENRA